LLKCDSHSGIRGILASDFHKRLTDVQANDAEVSELGQFDGQVSGARRHFEYTGAGAGLRGHEFG
jgi:hypothetical protein